MRLTTAAVALYRSGCELISSGFVGQVAQPAVESQKNIPGSWNNVALMYASAISQR